MPHRRTHAVLVFAALVGGCLLGGSPSAVAQPPDGSGRDTALYSADRPVDFIHMDLSLVMSADDVAARRCRGRVVYTLRPRAPRVRHVRLDAADMRIESVELPGRDAKPTFSYDDQVLTVELPEPLGPETTFQLAVAYRLVDPKAGMYFVLPTTARPQRGPVVYTMGEPLEARHWFPTHDWPNERWTCDLRFTVPAEYTAVANGVLQSKQPADDGKSLTFHYRHDVPTDPHLLGMAVGKLVELRSEWRGRPLLVFTQPGSEAAAAHTFRRVGEILEFYQQLLGVEYPYPGYTHVTIPDHHHGGMEHAGFSFMDPKFMAESDDGDWPLEMTESIYVSHMLAHQWFGGLVNYRSISEAWLNEGFAILLDSLWTSHTDGPNRFACKMWEMGQGVAATDSSESGQPMVNRKLARPGDVYLFDGSKVYFKGGWVLNMLRHQLGDELFWKSVAEYLRRHTGQGVATADLRSVLEETSGRDLEQFFAQWVFGRGVPRLEVDYSWSLESKQITLVVRQTQKFDSETPAFAFPLDVYYRAAGEDQRRTVEIRDARHEFRFPAATDPELFCVDPDGGLLKTLTVKIPDAMLRRQAEHGPTALARLMSVTDLAQKADAETIELLKRVVCREDEFWMVRAAAARGLGAQQTPEALAALLEAHTAAVAAPRARSALVEALGRYRHSAAAHTAVLDVAQREPGLYVEIDAVSALGRMRGERDLVERSAKWLRGLVQGPARRAVRQRAVPALAALDDPEANEKLWELAQPGADPEVRANAIATLGRISLKRERTLPTLTAWLDEPDPEIQAASAGALGSLGDPRSVSDLVRLRDSARSAHVRDAASGALAALRRAPPAEESRGALIERLQGIEEKNQALEKQLEAILKRLGGPDGEKPAESP